MSKIKTILDKVTDVVAIAAIAYIALEGNANIEVIAAIATIALGKKYMDLRSA